ncbi:MAG: tRNA 2-thiouridine(34) synthase MnmA [Myxococcales bacterium]|nr:tRNA 2-thiouridine(34) synthase MnmA [Myxococcales bacterium]
MSGGVDSSVAAAELRDQGHEVIGMTMRLYDAGAPDRSASGKRGRAGTCCSPAEVDQARYVCAQLGIPHYTVDERERFTRDVIDDFAREYTAGRTPNPCVRCNEHVKFGPLLARARAVGADALATGHYARVVDGALLRGVDRTKDQSYFLFAMGRAALGEVRFPLGTWRKEQVRERARALALPNWDAPDSVELCFVGGRDHAAVVRERAEQLGLETDALAPGAIVDERGRELGRHGGVHTVTVGQRRGLRVAGTEARYVLRVLPSRNEVVVGEREALAARAVELVDYRALSDDLADGAAREVAVQIRHRSPPARATATREGSRVTVVFAEPVSAAAPGQAGVVYDGERVLGGGWIA